MEKFFSTNKIHTIIGVHSVYSYALPLRIAINKGINVYTVKSSEISKLTKKNIFSSTNFFDYRKKFKKLNKAKKERGLKLAEQIIKKRTSGVGGISNHLVSNISAFHSKKTKRLIKKSDKIKVLICTKKCFLMQHMFLAIYFLLIIMSG